MKNLVANMSIENSNNTVMWMAICIDLPPHEDKKDNEIIECKLLKVYLDTTESFNKFNKPVDLKTTPLNIEKSHLYVTRNIGVILNGKSKLKKLFRITEIGKENEEKIYF